jgi:nitrogen fixation protein NifU and related proteins
MSELRDLYQEVILDHNRNPRNFGELPAADHHADGFNPLCGDRITVYLHVDDKDVIREARFKGSGCAISTASASMMTQALVGKTRGEAEKLYQEFHEMVTSDPTVEPDVSHVGKLAVFAGVREYPARVKCATLCWHTVRAALENKPDMVTTE